MKSAGPYWGLGHLAREGADVPVGDARAVYQGFRLLAALGSGFIETGKRPS